MDYPSKNETLKWARCFSDGVRFLQASTFESILYFCHGCPTGRCWRSKSCFDTNALAAESNNSKRRFWYATSTRSFSWLHLVELIHVTRNSIIASTLGLKDRPRVTVMTRRDVWLWAKLPVHVSAVVPVERFRRDLTAGQHSQRKAGRPRGTWTPNQAVMSGPL